jgi:hypothetical protein
MPREVRASWSSVILALILVCVGVSALIDRDGSHLALFGVYFAGKLQTAFFHF